MTDLDSSAATNPDLIDCPVASTIKGDRLCTSCGFNLYGQQVVREPHYKLLIARCPECGTVTALAEYPSLGRWANRWAGLAAGLFLVVLVTMFAANLGTVYGFGAAITDEASNELAAAIASEHHAWFVKLGAEQKDNLSATVLGSNSIGGWSMIDGDWAAGQDFTELVNGNGVIGPTRWTSLWTLIPYGMVVFAWAVVWSCALVHLRRLRLLLVAGLLFGIVAAIDFSIASSWTALADGGDTTAWYLSRSLVLPRLNLLVHGFAALVMVAGLITGRPIARALITLLLPPRLRLPLSNLWIADGRALPKA